MPDVETSSSLFQDHYLSDDVREAIHDFALDARGTLIQEARDLLDGTYGLHKDVPWSRPVASPRLPIPKPTKPTVA